MLHDGTLVDELADECGGARDHEGENGVRVDDSTRAAVRILDNARIDVERGDLHPSKVRAHLEEKLRALEPRPTREPLSLASIVRAWATVGRLEHFPIGLSQIDEATGGGLVRGTRWIVVGAPNAGKTALAAHIVRRIAERGDIVVGVLAVDEPPDRFAARFVQQRGFTREECDARESYQVEQMADQLEALGVRVYDRSWTIEEAAAHVAHVAKERGTTGLLAIDSLQTVRCDRERAELESGRVLPITAATEARVQALRDVTENGSRLMIVATSEMVRAGYRKPRQGDEEIDPMAAGKNSGAIEYAALVQISMRPEAKHDGVIRVEIPKNKEGDGKERTVHRGNELYLELDRETQTLTEAEKPKKSSDESEGREGGAGAQKHADAGIVATVLAARPGLNATELRPACRDEGGSISNDRINVAVAALIRAGAVVTRKSGGAVAHYLDGRKLPEEVLGAITGPARNLVITARPPDEDAIRPELRAAVLEVLREQPGASTRTAREEAAARARARVTAAGETLRELATEGVIENRGSASRAAWHVTEKRVPPEGHAPDTPPALENQGSPECEPEACPVCPEPGHGG